MRFYEPVIYQTSYNNKKYIGQHIGNGRDDVRIYYEDVG